MLRNEKFSVNIKDLQFLGQHSSILFKSYTLTESQVKPCLTLLFFIFFISIVTCKEWGEVVPI